MTKLKNTAVIDHLAEFRRAGEKLSEDVFELSSLLLDISTKLEKKADRSEDEKAIYKEITSNAELIVKSILHANEYNNSIWVNYTPVIKHLGGEGVKK